MQLIITAYIVASIFFGHIRHAITTSGIVFNSLATYKIMLSVNEKV